MDPERKGERRRLENELVSVVVGRTAGWAVRTSLEVS
jgi:hypothetical protein